MKKEISGISNDTFQILMEHDYPGNVRELKNIIEYACAVCEENKIGVSSLPSYLISNTNQVTRPRWPSLLCKKDKLSKETLINILQECKWQRKEAAALLNISRSTLWSKMKKYRLI